MAVVNSFALFASATYPAVSDVLATAPVYGDAQNVLQGTFVPSGATIPAVTDVRDGVAVGAGLGVLELPVASQVLLGVGYGANGIELTGTLKVDDDSDTTRDITFNAGDDYLGSYALSWESDTFSPMTGTLYFTLVDDRGIEWLNASPTYSSQTTINLELTHADTKDISSDVYRYGIRHVDSSGVVRTLVKGFCSVAMSYANTNP